MASVSQIPVEVALEIVAYLQDESLMLPAVGQSATWVAPSDSHIIWKPRLSAREPNEGGTGEKGERSEPKPATRKRPHCNLKALRLTNRFFDKICQTFLYRELNLMLDLTWKRWKKITQTFILPKWEHIQRISVHMDTTDHLSVVRFAQQARNVDSILRQCKNLTSLALYYRHSDVQMVAVKDTLLSLLRDGRLSTLGIYSYRRLQDPDDRIEIHVQSLVQLLDALACDEHAQRSLRVLDLFTDTIPAYTFDLIRRHLRSLTSLVLRGVLCPPSFISQIWDVDQRPRWYPCPNLTRLRLCHFEPGHAAHIPSLVGHFKALEELTISACGNDNDFLQVLRPRGWSRRPEALCNTHRPLAVFHIEHMDDWEIYELGVIPTVMLIVTTVKKYHFLNAMLQDVEIFPRLQVLRLAPPNSWGTPTEGATEEGEQPLIGICQARNVELRRDALANWSCGCASEEGY